MPAGPWSLRRIATRSRRGRDGKPDGVYGCKPVSVEVDFRLRRNEKPVAAVSQHRIRVQAVFGHRVRNPRMDRGRGEGVCVLMRGGRQLASACRHARVAGEAIPMET